MSEPIENAEDAVRAFKNALWIKGGCEHVREVERRAATCPFCGHEHDRIPSYPGGCAVCEQPVIFWPIERTRQAYEGEGQT